MVVGRQAAGVVVSAHYDLIIGVERQMSATALKVRLLLGHEHRLVTDHREYEPALLEDRDKLQAERG
jgi:hypothetical protein